MRIGGFYMTASRVSQEVTEVLYEIDSKAKITQEVTEVLYEIDPKAKITQEVIEVLYPINYSAKVSQEVIEILYSSVEAIEDIITESGLLLNYVKNRLF